MCGRLMNLKQVHQSKSNNNTVTNKKYDGKKLKHKDNFWLSLFWCKSGVTLLISSMTPDQVGVTENRILLMLIKSGDCLEL